MSTERLLLMISDKDNVATALCDLEAGIEARVRLGEETKSVKALQGIPFGFKMALTDIARGNVVTKYGYPIGIASQPIRKGELVHIHNLQGARVRTSQAGSGRK